MPSLEQSYRTQNPDKNDASWTTTIVSAPEDVSGNLRPAFATLLALSSIGLIIPTIFYFLSSRGSPRLLASWNQPSLITPGFPCRNEKQVYAI
jgi:hypothetical protein